MQFKSLSLLLLTASSAFAASHVQKRDDDETIGEQIDDIIDNVKDIPSRVEENLEELKTWFDDFNAKTLIPDEIRTADDWFLSVASSLHASHTPDWFSELPESARDRLNSVAAEITEFAGEIGDDDDAKPTGGAGGDDNDDDSDDDDDDADTTPNVAPRPTGAVMASLAGAAGVLGLAIAL